MVAFRLFVSLVLLIAMAGLMGGCGDDNRDSCTVKDNGDGTKTIICPDGTEDVLNAGSDEDAGKARDVETLEDLGGNDDLGNGRGGPKKILAGSFAIENPDDLAWLQPYTEITGTLWIQAEDLPLVELPNLQTVAGDLLVEHLHSLKSFSLPALTTVGGDLIVSLNADLTSFSLPALASVGGDLKVQTNGELTSLSLPALVSVGGTLSVSSNGDLTSLSLPVLTSVGHLKVKENHALTSFSLPVLTSVGDGVHVVYNDSLTSFSLSALTLVGGLLYVVDNTALTSFSLPVLTSVGGFMGLWLNGNTALTSFSLSALRSVVGDLTVDHNNALAQCLVDALVQQIQAGEGIGGKVHLDDNNTNCTCSEVGGVLEATCP